MDDKLFVPAATIVFQLNLVDAIHPSDVPIKADNWYPRYQLSATNNTIQFNTWFTGKYWHLKADLVVFEKYLNLDFDSESIKNTCDIHLGLLIIDTSEKTAVNLSKVYGGWFEDLRLTKDNRILYLKKYPDHSKNFETYLDRLRFEAFMERPL